MNNNWQFTNLENSKRMKELVRDSKGRFVKGHLSIGGFKKGHKIREGFTHTEETKRKISNSTKGRAGSMAGKSMPEEAKIAIGNALRGKPIHKIRGANHYNWKNGITKLNRTIRHSVEYSNWRKAIYSRDDYTCQLCGKVGHSLNADHYPKLFSEILKEYDLKDMEGAILCDELWDINNGRTLCVKCHRKQSRFGGNQHVTV